MENIIKEDDKSIFNTENTPIKDELTPPSSPKYKTTLNPVASELSQFYLNDNININSEINLINEKRKINIFNFADEDEEKQNNENENNNKIIIEEKENDILDDINRISFAEQLMKIKPLRTSGNKINMLIKRKSLFPKNSNNSIFGNKNNINNNLRKTILFGTDFNKMKRISITNFNKLGAKKNNIAHIKNNIKNFVKYDNMFLDDEFYLRAPGSFPDDEEANYLLRYNFLEQNNYLEENRTSKDNFESPYIRQTNSISFNSHLENRIQSKIMLNSLSFSKIEEEKDEKGKEKNEKNVKKIIENKNKYVDEEEISGKNILYADIVKVNNNFEQGTFSKNLVSKENESKISYMSINLFIKKIALYNFRINYPLLYKAFLQQYNYFLTGTLFIEKIIQAFELYYNKNNKITNELINLLNIIISENYENIKEDLVLLEKIKQFYLYLKQFHFTEIESALEKEIDNIYYIFFETDSEEDIDYSRRFIHERKKSNSIFIKSIKSKELYSNIFNKIQTVKTTKKRRVMVKNKTTIGAKYFYIFAHTPMEIAQYLTCISYQMMRNINQKELLNKNFTCKEKETRAPNVMKMIDRFNKLVFFVIEDICSYDNKKTRCQCIEKWIEIGLKLKELHNFNDLVMINTCFVNLTLNKLKLTFKKLSTKYKNIIKEMNIFCSSKECYINIRRLIFNSKGIPYIPYLGIILKEIMMIEEMKYIIDENNINFSKLVKIYNVISKFNEFKKIKFSFEQSKELDILINLNPKNEDELEELVSQIEPKLKIFANRGNKKRLTNTDKFYYYKKQVSLKI